MGLHHTLCKIDQNSLVGDLSDLYRHSYMRRLFKRLSFHINCRYHLYPSQSGDMKHSSSMSTIGITIARRSLSVSPESVTLTQVQSGNSSPEEQASPSVSQKGSSTDTTPKGKPHFKWRKVKGAITGLNLEKEKFRVGMPYSFKLHCEDLGDGAPEITCKPLSGAEINLIPAKAKAGTQNKTHILEHSLHLDVPNT